MKSLEKLNLNNKKFIIFDMDGTLIDSIGIWNITDYRVLKKLTGKEFDLESIQKERDNFLENNASEDIYLEYGQYLINKYLLNINKEELLKMRWKISDEYLVNEIDYKPYAVDLIKKLKENGYTLIIATSTSTHQIDIYANKNKKMIKQLKILDYFDLIVTKEDIYMKKPDPEIYLKIINHYNSNPDKFLAFEDSLHGIISANKANIEVVNVYDKYSDINREEINELTDYKINTFKEIIDLLK